MVFYFISVLVVIIMCFYDMCFSGFYLPCTSCGWVFIPAILIYMGFLHDRCHLLLTSCKLDSLVYMGQRQCMSCWRAFEVVVVPVDRKHVLCNGLGRACSA
jgi:hypothetical protein